MSGAVVGAAIGSVVPGVGTAIGGVVGEAYDIVQASGALDWLGKHLLGTKGAEVAAQVVQAAVSAGAPDAAAVAGLAPDARATLTLQLQQLAVQRDAADRQADLEQIKAGLSDTASARGQTVDLAKTGSGIAWGAPTVSVVVLITFASAVGVAMLHALPSGAETMLNILLGTLAAMATQVVNYWLGSSVGSAQKTALLAQAGPIPK